jgi:hypothetical protein
VTPAQAFVERQSPFLDCGGMRSLTCFLAAFEVADHQSGETSSYPACLIDLPLDDKSYLSERAERSSRTIALNTTDIDSPPAQARVLPRFGACN